jgi:hypothetical protein
MENCENGFCAKLFPDKCHWELQIHQYETPDGIHDDEWYKKTLDGEKKAYQNGCVNKATCIELYKQVKANYSSRKK